MLDDIRNWLGDMASGKIKDAHLALSEAQNASFLRDIENLIRERDDLLAKVRVLETSLADSLAENRVLAAKLPKAEGSDEGPNEEEAKILQFFFDAQESSREDAANALRIPLPRATHHVGSLLQRSFLRQSKASMGPRYPAKFRITHEGSSHIMKNG